MNRNTVQELIRLGEEWNRAMVQNDAEAIGRYMADDWTIIGPDGSVSDKPTFLELVESGALSDVFVRQDGQWRCVSTHLSRIATPGAE